VKVIVHNILWRVVIMRARTFLKPQQKTTLLDAMLRKSAMDRLRDNKQNAKIVTTGSIEAEIIRQENELPPTVDPIPEKIDWRILWRDAHPEEQEAIAFYIKHVTEESPKYPSTASFRQCCEDVLREIDLGPDSPRADLLLQFLLYTKKGIEECLEMRKMT
jgi:hypothetical protein